MQSTGHTSTQLMSTQSRHSFVITQAISHLSRWLEPASPRRTSGSAELRLLVEHVLAHHRIVLLELELVRRVLSVLHRGVEVSGSRARLELDALALSLLRHRSLLGPGSARVRHRGPGVRKHAHAPALADLDADAARLAATVDQHHVGGVDVALLLDDPAGSHLAAPGLQVPLLDADLLDAHTAAGRVHGEHLALLAAIGALHHQDHVALADAERHARLLDRVSAHSCWTEVSPSRHPAGRDLDRSQLAG